MAQVAVRSLFRFGLALCMIWLPPQMARGWQTPFRIDSHSTTTVRFGTQVSTAAGAVWGTVWASDGETTDTANGVFFSRSPNGGSAWETPREVSGVGNLPPGSWGASPSLATDGNQAWIIGWDACRVSGKSIDPRRDILFVRSADGGGTWSAPATLNSTAVDPRASHYSPALAADGQGHWLAAFETRWTADSDWTATRPICVARSLDNGQSWLPLTALDPETSIAQNRSPAVATDGGGTWIVAWESRGTTDSDIRFCRSTDGGATWASGAWLNSYAQSDDTRADFNDSQPRLATNGNQVWIAVWTSSFDPGQSVPVSDRIVYSRSADNGLTWSVPAPVVSSGAGTTVRQTPDVVWNGSRFVALWAGPAGLEASTLQATGGAWTAPVSVATGTDRTSGRLTSPRLAGAGGVSMAGWAFRPAGSAGPDLSASTDANQSAARDWAMWE